MANIITKQSTAKQKEQLVMDLIKWLVDRDLFMDVNIYCNNKCWSSNVFSKACLNIKTIEDKTISEKPFYMRENVKAKDYVEYADEDLITMTFEGPLHFELNHGTSGIYEDLEKFFAERKLSFSRGHSWSLFVYEI